MDPLERFAAYAADFEKTFEDDDWTRLEGYFAEDATYSVKGTPFDCEVRGRDAIFRAIKKSIDGFDRRFDKREIVPDGPPVVAGNRVTFSGSARYEKGGAARRQHPAVDLESVPHSSPAAEQDAQEELR